MQLQRGVLVKMVSQEVTAVKECAPMDCLGLATRALTMLHMMKWLNVPMREFALEVLANVSAMMDSSGVPANTLAVLGTTQLKLHAMAVADALACESLQLCRQKATAQTPTTHRHLTPTESLAVNVTMDMKGLTVAYDRAPQVLIPPITHRLTSLAPIRACVLMRQASASALRDGVAVMVAEAMEQTTTVAED
jgi:hypothetical protein